MPDLTLLSVLVVQVCPLISEILRQLDVKLLKSLMGECPCPSREDSGGRVAGRGAPTGLPGRPAEGGVLAPALRALRGDRVTIPQESGDSRGHSDQQAGPHQVTYSAKLPEIVAPPLSPLGSTAPQPETTHSSCR